MVSSPRLCRQMGGKLPESLMFFIGLRPESFMQGHTRAQPNLKRPSPGQSQTARASGGVAAMKVDGYLYLIPDT